MTNEITQEQKKEIIKKLSHSKIDEALGLAIEIEFETLGNVLADCLLTLEKKEIKKFRGEDIDETFTELEEQISCLVDSYARRLDKILNSYKADMTKNIVKIIEELKYEFANQ